MAEPEQRLTVVRRDPTDNIVLECAVAGEAAYIVIGGDGLLDLHSFRGITICTLATFQSIVRSTHSQCRLACDKHIAACYAVRIVSIYDFHRRSSP